MQGLIDGYVRRVDALLPGGRSVRDDLLTELRDGLADAAAAHRRTGLDAQQAEVRAVREAGPAPEVAAAYGAELVASQGQSTAAFVGLSLPAVVLSWSVLWHFAGGAVAVQWPVSPLVFTLSRIVDWSAYLGGAATLAGLAMLIWFARSGRDAGQVVRGIGLVGCTTLLVHCCANVTMNVLLLGSGLSVSALALGPSGLLGAVTLGLTGLQLRSLWRTLRICFDRRARTR
jgi:hypothetical protein